VDSFRRLLLREGLARYVDWSAAFLPAAEATSLRQTERGARDSRKRIWRTWAPPSVSGEREFLATVVEVPSGDTIVVRPASAPESTRRLQLASLRAPRMGRRDEAPQAWATDAREFLRKRIIGHSVTIVVDYERDPPAGATDGQRPSVTIAKIAGKSDNPSVELVRT
jgi:staphylococcal nuclease domain-containing protein 1